MQVEARIEHMERQVHKLRDAFAAEQQALSEATDEVEIMRNTLNKTEGEWSAEQGTNGVARCVTFQCTLMHTRPCWVHLLQTVRACS